MEQRTEKSKSIDMKKYFTFKFDIQNLVTLGMLLATFIVLDYLTIKVGTGMKFNLAFIAVAIAGALYGPLPTALMCVAGDILVCILGGDAPLWQLTVTAALTGLIYGFFLYGRTGKNLALFSIFARIADSIIITIGLNTLILMSVGFLSPTLPAFISRLTKALIEIPVYSLVLAVLLPQIILLHHKIYDKSR
ncbi:MAG: folate family ECF transporter S component [Ruminococcus sp.]|jgi:ECF transporter S component (folate family)|nr:folate family ECF transporter S component [Ruminococcus sp.]